MDLGLTGRSALVAAGTSGLGRAAAEALAAEGADVAVCGRDADRVAETVAALRDCGPGRHTGQAVDVTDEDAVTAWVDGVAAAFGSLHVVVANGPGPTPGPVDELTLDDYREGSERSLFPQIGLTLAALPHLRAAGWGRVLLVASEAVVRPIPQYGASSVVRVALVGFARSLARQVGSDGITVNVVAPGYHRTPGLTGHLDDPSADLERIAADIPVGRVGEAADFGAVVAMLASEQAGYITGETVLVDGGRTST